MNSYNVFVYGTLRQNGINHHILADSICIQTQLIIKGYCLYDYQHWYPYMVEGNKNDQVVGEVYRVNQPIREKLDILEDVENQLYKWIYLHSYQCYTYIKYNNDVNGLMKIDSGDWIKFINN